MADLPTQSTLYRQIFDLKPRKGDLTKLRILEALVDEISEDNVANFNFEKLGKRCGMRRAHIMYHFPDRVQMVRMLLQFIIAVGQDITIERLKSASTWKEQMRAWIETPFEWLERHPKHGMVMRLFYYLCAHDASLRVLHTEIRKMGAERGSTILKAALGKKLSSKRAAVLSKAIQCQLNGAVLEWITTEPVTRISPLKNQCVLFAFDLIKAEALRLRL